MTGKTIAPGTREFIALVALLMSLVALSTDAMLPALGEMARDLHAGNANDRQIVISMLFLGLAIGQLFYGPLSDTTGRKPALCLGLGLFILGALVAALAPNFPVLLTARVMQGLGAAGPRIVAIAIVRDQFSGNAMARTMSMSTSVLMIVPIIAPGVGQLILFVANWRMIYALLFALGCLAFAWFALRQPETLARSMRRPFSLRRIAATAVEAVTHRVTLGYTLASSCLFGAFIGYINSTQQMFAEAYGLGTAFPLFFGALALALSLALIVNAKLVMRLGMQKLSIAAATTLASLSILFSIVAWHFGGLPPLFMLMAYFLCVFFCSGILFGNFNALAMEPMGEIAGVASAVVGSLNTIVSLILGSLIGLAYNGTALPLVIGFALTGSGAVTCVLWAESGRRPRGRDADR
jgi:DHA1 family bicyclomycin/chloramphenicol resistance-like MFS transporter